MLIAPQDFRLCVIDHLAIWTVVAGNQGTRSAAIGAATRTAFTTIFVEAILANVNRKHFLNLLSVIIPGEEIVWIIVIQLAFASVAAIVIHLHKAIQANGCFSKQLIGNFDDLSTVGAFCVRHYSILRDLIEKLLQSFPPTHGAKSKRATIPVIHIG
jgi:hypothetical protein